MILTPHLLIGAAIGAKTHNLGMIIILGILSHFILDKLPHWDYSVPGIKKFKKTKSYKNLFIDLFKIMLDGFLGLIIAFILIINTNQLNNWKFILLGILFAILPDIFLFLSYFFESKFLTSLRNIHHRLHYPREKKKEGEITFPGITVEILVLILAALVFFF